MTEGLKKLGKLFYIAFLIIILLYSQIPTSQGNSVRDSVRTAVVRPVFTATAYSSFYNFYGLYLNAPRDSFITTPQHLRLLNASIVDSWGWSLSLAEFIEGRLAHDRGLSPVQINDVDVHEGKLFDQNRRKYDVLILGFTEYVTAKQYREYKNFVATGGRIIFLDATQFLAEVDYHPQAKRLSLVKGHGWNFNGTHAWKGDFHRWFNENTEWIGSNYGVHFSGNPKIEGAIPDPSHPLGVLLRNTYGKNHSLFRHYKQHEENTVTNPNVKIIVRWNILGGNRGQTVASYELNHLRGAVLHTGIMASDIIGTDPEMQYFLIQMINYALNSTVLDSYAQSGFEAKPLWSYKAGGRISPSFLGGSLALSGDGKYVVLGSEDGFLHLLDAGNGRVFWKQRMPQAVLGVDVSLEATRIVAFTGVSIEQHETGSIIFFDRDGEQLWSVDGGPGGKTVAVSSGGRYVASSGDEGVTFRSDDGNVLWSIGRSALPHGTLPVRVAISPAAIPSTLVISEDTRIQLIDSSGRSLWTYHTLEPILSSAASSNSEHVVIASQDGFLRYLDGKGNLLRLVSLPSVRSIAMNSQGDYVVAGLGDGQVRFFDLSGNQLLSMKVSESPIDVVDVSEDGRFVVVASLDTVSMFQVKVPTIAETALGPCRLTASQYYLSVFARYGNVAGSGTHDSCSVVKLTATQIIDHNNGTRRVFTDWVGDWFSNSPELSILMEKNGSVTANYKTQFYLTVESAYGNPSSSGWYDAGDLARLSVTSTVDFGNATRRIFFSWKGDLVSSSNTPSIIINSPKKIVADWKTQYFLKIDPQGGIASGEGWYDANSEATVSAQSPSNEVPASSRLVFKSWSGDVVSDSPTIKVKVDRPILLSTNWRTQFFLSIDAGGGFVDRGSSWVDKGEAVLVTATSPSNEIPENTRMIFTGWRGSVDSSELSVSFTMQDANGLIASWEPEYYLKISSAYGSPKGEGWYRAGQSAQVSVEPSVSVIVQQVFNGWSGDFASTKADDAVIMDRPRQITATWKEDYTQLELLLPIFTIGAIDYGSIRINRKPRPKEDVISPEGQSVRVMRRPSLIVMVAPVLGLFGQMGVGHLYLRRLKRGILIQLLGLILSLAAYGILIGLIKLA
ncbi:MAG: PQQ-binding-like beta-propeller repeat protein [Thaumarchaeota archaeon]|nr:PQQ-binding-like beta-propeller repeat protein [Nitrososphaerota archaeon]